MPGCGLVRMVVFIPLQQPSCSECNQSTDVHAQTAHAADLSTSNPPFHMFHPTFNTGTCSSYRFRQRVPIQIDRLLTSHIKQPYQTTQDTLYSAWGCIILMVVAVWLRGVTAGGACQRYRGCGLRLRSAAAAAGSRCWVPGWRQSCWCCYLHVQVCVVFHV